MFVMHYTTIYHVLVFILVGDMFLEINSTSSEHSVFADYSVVMNNKSV